MLSFWAIVGWEVIGNYSKEVDEPKRTIPKAVKISAVAISLIYLLVVCAIQFTSLKHPNAITALTYLLFGTLSEGVIGILAMLLCLSTVLLFVGGVSRLICGLSSEYQGVKQTSLKWLTYCSYTVFMHINALVIGLVYLNVFTIEDLVALADGFFIANAAIELFAEYTLATTQLIRCVSINICRDSLYCALDCACHHCSFCIERVAIKFINAFTLLSSFKNSLVNFFLLYCSKL